MEYVIKKYCVNKDKPQLSCKGKCHLSKKFSSSITENSSNKSSISNALECFTPVFYTNQDALNYLHYEEPIPLNPKIFYSNNNYSFDYEFQHFRPPIV